MSEQTRIGYGDAPDAIWATEIEDVIADIGLTLGNMNGGPGQQVQPTLDKLWALRCSRFDGQGPTRKFGEQRP